MIPLAFLPLYFRQAIPELSIWGRIIGSVVLATSITLPALLPSASPSQTLPDRLEENLVNVRGSMHARRSPPILITSSCSGVSADRIYFQAEHHDGQMRISNRSGKSYLLSNSDDDCPIKLLVRSESDKWSEIAGCSYLLFGFEQTLVIAPGDIQNLRSPQIPKGNNHEYALHLTAGDWISRRIFKAGHPPDLSGEGVCVYH